MEIKKLNWKLRFLPLEITPAIRLLPNNIIVIKQDDMHFIELCGSNDLHSDVFTSYTWSVKFHNNAALNVSCGIVNKSIKEKNRILLRQDGYVITDDKIKKMFTEFIYVKDIVLTFEFFTKNKLLDIRKNKENYCFKIKNSSDNLIPYIKFTGLSSCIVKLESTFKYVK